MANDQNLKPFNQLPPDLHRALSQKGGKASGAARRAKRERIEHEKESQKARNELFQDAVQLLKETTRLYKRSL